MDYTTTLIDIGGSDYLRIPKEFLKPLGADTEKRPLKVRIRSETNKRGEDYIAAWVDGK